MLDVAQKIIIIAMLCQGIAKKGRVTPRNQDGIMVVF